jgi:aminodeoxyfutalosine deaminase
MSYRKLKADYLFDGFNVFGSDTVLVCKRDGTIVEIVEQGEAGSDVERYTGLISPGFINCHCHLELSHLKGLIPENLGLVNFVLSLIGQRKQPEESMLAAICSAESEMKEAGIVAVGDISNSKDTAGIKMTGNLNYYNFIELLGWSPDQAVSRYKNGMETAAFFLEKSHDENHLSLNPHAPYSVSPELWNLMIPGFSGKTITIHNQESAAENEFFKTGGGDLTKMYSRMKIDNSYFKFPGTNSLPYYLRNLKSASRIILVHNTYMDENDLCYALSMHEQLYFCLCPQANRYIENRLPDIPGFLKHTNRMVLGTDSLASNKNLSILEEMKLIKEKFPGVPTSQMLGWATSNGASALSFSENFGDFNKGKRPGIVLVENLLAGEIGTDSTCRRIV